MLIQLFKMHGEGRVKAKVLRIENWDIDFVTTRFSANFLTI